MEPEAEIMESCWHQQSFPHPLKHLPNMLNMWLYLVTVYSSEITVLYAQEGLLDLHLHVQKFYLQRIHPIPSLILNMYQTTYSSCMCFSWFYYF